MNENGDKSVVAIAAKIRDARDSNGSEEKRACILQNENGFNMGLLC